MALEDLKLNDETSGDLGGYFHVTITDLDLGTQYPLEFQYIYADKRLNDNWSAVKYFTTVGATVPNDPQLLSTDVVGGAGFIKVTWSGNDAGGSPIANFDRVDVHISGTTFGDGTKPAGSFKSAGTQTFTCVPGIYIVQLKVYSLNGESSFFSTARTVTVTEVGEVIQAPKLATGISVVTQPFAVSVNWPGTYQSGETFTGFKSIDIYAVGSDLGSSATSGISSTNLVGSLTVQDTANKINIGLDNLRQALGLSLNSDVYGSSIFYYYNATNKNGDKYGSPTYTRINSSSVVPTKANFIDLANGVISIENLVAGNGNFSSWLRTGTSGGARIELSGVSDFSNGGYTVEKGLTAYSSGSTKIFDLNLDTGSLEITGKLTATQIATSSGKFSVNTSGILVATSADIDGTIKADSGNIGGIIIASDAIQNGSTSGNSTFRLDNTGKARFGTASGNAIILNPSPSSGGYYIYHSSNGGTAASGKFSVSDGGVLTATGGNFSGTITNGSDFWNANNTFRLGGADGINKASATSNSITIGSNVTISGSITATSLDTTSLDIASNGAITTTSGNFGVTSGGILSATGANISGSLTTNGTAGGYANNTLTVSGGKLSADKVIYLETDILTGVVDVVASAISLEAPTEILGSIRASASATFGVTGSLFEFLSSSGNVRVAQTYNNDMGGTTRAMRVSTAGLYGYASSTRRRKEEIENYSINSESLLSLPIKKFKYKNDDSGVQQYGFIAEEAQDLGLDELIQYDSDGIPDYFAYETLPVFLLQLIQEQDTSIKSMKLRLDALEA